jgi:tetratricopeptide (TPR) repeat protein
MHAGGSRCSRCKAPLAADNPNSHCSGCQPAVLRLGQGPPRVTASFWQHPSIQQAAADRNMGRLLAAYRRHPAHGMPIAQEIIGLWAGMSQAQISRYETRSADRQIDRLQFWARLLAIPPGLLWFAMPPDYRNEAVVEAGLDPAEGTSEPRTGDLVFTQDYLWQRDAAGSPTSPAAESAWTDHEQSPRPAVASGAPADAETLPGDVTADDPLSRELAGLRRQLDEALAAGSVSVRQLEEIEKSTRGHVDDYPATPPTVMLTRIASECAEVTALSRRRQPAAVQARLSSCAALLATLCADALMRLGQTTDAQLWYRTATFAADDSERPALGVLVRAQAAMLPYYFGDARQTVRLADEALSLPAKPCRSGALAAASKARALARIGDTAAAHDAVTQARKLFEQVGGDDSDAAFRFPVKRFLFYLAGAATWMGDTRAAYRLQDEALALYRASNTTSIDPALILLDRARCLVEDTRAQEAATVALDAVAMLPERQRTEIVLARAFGVVAAVPNAERHGSVVDLEDYVQQCRQRTRMLAGGRTALSG